MIRKGTWVRLRRQHRNGPWQRHQCAQVVSNFLTFGDTREYGACFLSHRLEGVKYWNLNDLERAQKPPAALRKEMDKQSLKG
jgi:hypothetical protein